MSRGEKRMSDEAKALEEPRSSVRSLETLKKGGWLDGVFGETLKHDHTNGPSHEGLFS